MSDIKTVSASLDIEVWVDCPHCDNRINLMDADDTDGYDHNEEGHILKQACPDGYWSDSHEVFSVEDVTCTECKKDFNVKELEWQP